MNFPDPLESAAIARPDHPAIVADRTWSWAELRDAVAACAGALAEVRTGQRVAITATHTPATMVQLFALARRGAAVALLPAHATPAEREAALRVLRPDHVDPSPGEGAPTPERDWPANEVRVVVLTSGTTGAPRAVALRSGALLLSAMGSALRLGHHLDDRWLHCLPLHHVGGVAILLRCALYGTTIEWGPGFDAEGIARRLDAGAVSLVSLTPSMLSEVLDARRARPFPKRLRAVLLGGAETPTALLERCRALRVPLARTWGMTEAGSQVCTAYPGDLDGPLPPLAFARVHREPDEVLRVSGPIVEGALRTSDVGVVDAGRVAVSGRRDDLILSGGVNLSPAEIEATLEAHPAVREAAVVGVAHPRWGSRPVAALVGRGARPDDPALRAWCRSLLAPYKTPDAFHWVAELPRDALGKLRRRALREELEATHAFEEGFRHGDGGELGQGDERVLEPHDVAHVVGIPTAAEAVGEGHRARPHDLHGRVDLEPVAEADGARVVRLDVDQGHPEVEALEERAGFAERGHQKLLEAGVGVLEGAAEEHDADPIDFEETGGEGMDEGHGAWLRRHG